MTYASWLPSMSVGGAVGRLVAERPCRRGRFRSTSGSSGIAAPGATTTAVALRVGEHLPPTLGRPLRIDRHERAARGQDGQHGDHHLGRARQRDGDHLFVHDAPGAQVIRQLVGPRSASSR